jgi:hypothetical protein
MRNSRAINFPSRAGTELTILTEETLREPRKFGRGDRHLPDAKTPPRIEEAFVAEIERVRTR